MFAPKIFILAVLVVVVQCRYVEEYGIPRYQIYDRNNIMEDDYEDALIEQRIRESYVPSARVRRQVQGSMNTNPDGTFNLNAKLPLAGNENNRLSAIGGLGGLKNGGSYGSATAGLALDNINGHALSVTGRQIPNVADQLTAAAKVNLLHTDNHNLDANAFYTKTMPKAPGFPNFDTTGGSLDYMFKDKVGGSFGVSNTDLFKRTDYSAMGNLNLFRNRDSSLDMNAGFTKSVSPFLPNQGWQPSAGLSYTKFW